MATGFFSRRFINPTTLVRSSSGEVAGPIDVIEVALGAIVNGTKRLLACCCASTTKAAVRKYRFNDTST